MDPCSLYKGKLDAFDFPFFSEEEDIWLAYKLKLHRKIPFSLIDFFLEGIAIIFSLLYIKIGYLFTNYHDYCSSSKYYQLGEWYI